MTIQPDLTRKVRQLDNDVQSIYEMLARIEATQKRQSNRLNEVGEVVDAVSDRVTKIATVQAEQGAMLGRIVALLEHQGNTNDLAE